MGDLNKHIHRKRSDPYENILSHSLEKDKRQKEESPTNSSNMSLKTQLFSMVSSYLQHLTRWINPYAHLSTSSPSCQKSLEDVKNFRKLLTLLAREDCSHSPNFNQQLSELWHNLLDDCNSLPKKEPLLSLILDKIKFFASQIKNFPVDSEYTLGYYLAEHVGAEWTPFPCMKLLQELHEEFLKTPSQSTLHRWILLLDEISLLSAQFTKRRTQ